MRDQNEFPELKTLSRQELRLVIYEARRDLEGDASTLHMLAVFSDELPAQTTEVVISMATGLDILKEHEREAVRRGIAIGRWPEKQSVTRVYNQFRALVKQWGSKPACPPSEARVFAPAEFTTDDAVRARGMGIQL